MTIVHGAGCTKGDGKRKKHGGAIAAGFVTIAVVMVGLLIGAISSKVVAGLALMFIGARR